MSLSALRCLQRISVILITVASLSPLPARAATTVRAAKAVAVAFPFVVLDVGLKEGIFAKYGVVPTLTSFTGDAKMQEGLASDSVDVGLGGGPAMAFAAKGSPVLAVAAFGGPPRDLSVIVAANSPIKTIADLKGKRIAVSTVGSLTAWLAHQISIKQGWGENGVQVVATGAGPAMISAILTGGIDAGIGATGTALSLAAKHQGRSILSMDKVEPDFITHVIFARKAFIQQQPQSLDNFLKGFFATIAWMRTHKTGTIAVAANVLHKSPDVLNKVYDFEMPMLLSDGQFDPAALKVIKQSFVDMKTLPSVPADDQILTRQFLPVKP